MGLVHHAEQDIWISGTEGTLCTEVTKESDRRDGPNDLCTRLLVLMISGDYLLLVAISQHHKKLIIMLVVQHKEQNCRCTGSMKSISYSTKTKFNEYVVWYFFFYCYTHKDTCLSLFLLSLSGSSLSAIRPSSSCCRGVCVPIIFCSSQSILRICLQKAGDALKSVSEPAYLIWWKTEDTLLKSSLLQKSSFQTFMFS